MRETDFALMQFDWFVQQNKGIGDYAHSLWTHLSCNFLSHLPYHQLTTFCHYLDKLKSWYQKIGCDILPATCLPTKVLNLSW